MANTLNFSGPKIPFYAMRRVNKFHEPMRTRVLFYLEQIARQKAEGDDLTEADLNASVSRADKDRCDDKEITLRQEDVKRYNDDFDSGKNSRPLKELLHAV